MDLNQVTLPALHAVGQARSSSKGTKPVPQNRQPHPDSGSCQIAVRHAAY